MELQNIKRVYFIGVGGIGMSALARFFKEKGAIVQGYDKTETDLTRQLVAEGIGVSYEDEISQADQEAQLVVYTPAIPNDNKLLTWYRNNNFSVFKRSDVLQWITESMFSITVGGTHGKTTISAMIAHILRDSGMGCNAFLGGITVNYKTNYWSSENEVAVVEADEYDRSFLKLRPDIAVLTSMDADHLDIYGTPEAMQEAYVQYTANIKPNGTLVKKHGLKNGNLLQGSEKISYSLQNSSADAYADGIQMKNGGYLFDVKGKGIYIPQVHMDIGGMHNVENCVAAIVVAKKMDVDDNDIKSAVSSFKGVKRRFEYVVKNDKVVYIDDYAHHPEELASLLKSAKTLFPKRRMVVAFQPHLYSRTRDLADCFAHSLDMADEIILLDIYPAREQPIAGITSETIKQKMGNPNVTILTKDGLLNYVKTAPLDLFITAGAGDIDKLVPSIEVILENRK